MVEHQQLRYSKTLLKKAYKGTRGPTRRRFAAPRIPKTPGERATLKAQRFARRQDLNADLKDAQKQVMEMAIQLQQKYRGHSVEWYFEAILQQARADGKKRAPNNWNAFLHVKTRELNDALPEGERRLTASERAAELKVIWNKIPESERAEFAKEMVEDLEKFRENKDDAVHNFSLMSYHDAHSTLKSCADELNRMAGRTDTRVMLMAVRSDNEHVLTPYFYASDISLATYFHALTRYTPHEFLAKLESCTISGLIGLIHNAKDEFVMLKKEVVLEILIKLRKATNYQWNRTPYLHFDDAVTYKYGVVVENWPLKTFASPSSVTNLPELKVLLSAWETKTTSFRKMSDEEWAEWRTKHELKRMQEMNMAIDSVQTSASTPSQPGSPSHPAASEIAPSQSSPSEVAPSQPTPSQAAFLPVAYPPTAYPSPAAQSLPSPWGPASTPAAAESTLQFVMSDPNGKAIRQPRAKPPRKSKKKATPSHGSQAVGAATVGEALVPAASQGLQTNTLAVPQAAHQVYGQTFEHALSSGVRQDVSYSYDMPLGQQDFSQHSLSAELLNVGGAFNYPGQQGNILGNSSGMLDFTMSSTNSFNVIGNNNQSIQYDHSL
ncbi:hypothetical protein CONPUDRAFT_154797 [Coniophora puteana RWD-64-598 SS2]|uniref:Uncharacterized protein n=1 Tax=Coniophora puteana (strain RWD-64-598) TaxID=741705 RepID=A0A5M3MNR0_CONPW|nr:uncharacterized protein CONPUDRAFT_154797 [Coniophora puteana RWD-64-598 SS2]EIW80799.1 hypothetical protein CONPUDRAFT_154797 [Coniophora puteana RWD-64-598 SS2]